MWTASFSFLDKITARSSSSNLSSKSYFCIVNHQIEMHLLKVEQLQSCSFQTCSRKYFFLLTVSITCFLHHEQINVMMHQKNTGKIKKCTQLNCSKHQQCGNHVSFNLSTARRYAPTQIPRTMLYCNEQELISRLYSARHAALT